MTETDRIYVAVMETMKKYNPEQAIAALSKYITEGNARYFTNTNSARGMICEVPPLNVLKDALRSVVKAEMITREKGYAQVLPNYSVIEQSINEYRSGVKISNKLSSGDLSELIIRMLNIGVRETLDLLAKNPEVFESLLAKYSVVVCNFRKELNEIPNTNFPNIEEYFARAQAQMGMQR